MRYAVASLWTIPALFLLCVAGAFGALKPFGHYGLWLFVADVVAMLGFAVMALVEAAEAEPGAERQRTIALSVPMLVFGLGAALVLYTLTHATMELS